MKQTLTKLLGTLLFIAAFSGILNAQKSFTLFLKPNATNGKDATVIDIDPTSNYGTYSDFIANAWTNGGKPLTQRSFIQFDLSSIPANATITSASMSLYCDQNSSNTQLQSYYPGSTYNTPNPCYLQRVTSSWSEDSVTWNNQPTTTTSNEVTLAASTSNTEDYTNINVTQLVSDMVSKPSSSYGFALKLVTETAHRALVFASSDNTDADWWPELLVTYTVSCDTSITLQPGPGNGKDATVIDIDPASNYGTYPDFIANAWTYNSNPLIQRSFIQFDLSSLPANMSIKDAGLSLYCNTTSSNIQLQSDYSGSPYPLRNDAELLRVAQPWNASTVTWNNQPTVDTTQVFNIPPSTSQTENYLSMDVTSAIQDMYSNPTSNYGFMFRLNNENYYRALVFASSDNTNASIRPSLEICYNKKTLGTENENFTIANIRVSPTLTNSKLNIYIDNLAGTNNSLTVRLYSVDGRLMSARTFNTATDVIQYAVNNLAQGLYLCEITCNNDRWVTKIVKTQ